MKKNEKIISLLEEQALDTISRHCPEALSTYIQCLYRADEEGKVSFTYDEVDVDLSEEWEVFRSNVKKLAQECLLEWHPRKGNEGIDIILANLEC